MTEPLTIDEALADLLAIQKAMPHTTNPRNADDVCLYTSSYDPDKHCLMGQLGAKRGYYVPDNDVEDDIATVAVEHDWPVSDDCIAFLSAVQQTADWGVTSNGAYPCWGEINLRKIAADTRNVLATQDVSRD